MSGIITLAHGSGGRMTHNLINDIFAKYFSNEVLLQGDDAGKFELERSRVAFTTDSFVISPVFFKGGDIGKLAVCGTVNDLAASGARPLYLTCGFILEEGLPLDELEKIVSSMKKAADESGIKIASGDTKVVQKGAADKIFINTSGIGVIPEGVDISGSHAQPGDAVIVTGTIGDHGCSILLQRENLDISSPVESDCAPLSGLVEKVLSVTTNVHVMRDPTRGGLATTLNEIALQSNTGIRLNETDIPVKDEVRGVCELLGMDYMYMANEGKMIIIAPKDKAGNILDILKKDKYGKDAAIVGEVVDAPAKRVTMRTLTGGSRIVDMLAGDQLPRIC